MAKHGDNKQVAASARKARLRNLRLMRAFAFVVILCTAFVAGFAVRSNDALLESLGFAALLESGAFEQVTVMVQKEVAQRICAEPGTAAYSAFSIYVQYHAKAEILFDVPADCFVPKPKVDSAVLKLVPLDKPAVETKDEKLFFALVRAAFNMRRKTLVNALGPVLGSSMSKEEITALVEAAGLDARVRGERLSLAEYAKLADLAAEKLQ